MSHLNILKGEAALRKKVLDNEKSLKELWLKIQELNNEHTNFLDDLEVFLKSYNH